MLTKSRSLGPSWLSHDAFVGLLVAFQLSDEAKRELMSIGEDGMETASELVLGWDGLAVPQT